MHRFRILEAVATRFLGIAAVISIVLVVATYSVIVGRHLTNVDAMAKFTDAVFKTAALLLGALWAINRYFVERTDAPQFRVDCDVSMVHGSSRNDALLIFRLDLVNTGKTRIAKYNQFTSIEAVEAKHQKVEYETLYRWPTSGLHSGAAIEPGSWAAINAEVACSSTVKAVRVFLQVESSDDDRWTWHKTFDVSEVGK